MRKLGGLVIQSPDEIKDKFNTLIYGDSGAGKTVLAGSASNVLEMNPVIFVDIEGGTLSLNLYKDIDVVKVDSWTSAIRVKKDLQKDSFYKDCGS